ncbi:uncharacterized protein LOC127121457 [Lathyrus oleraceus]|uniref:uncharacterized protein LOC127121457 n=1 Tax=Pisum sativum TaxID=3888 RepID=UPI0021D3C3F1|nr:uncharacterized protein LOC127121457 [Pisum sativum]
MRMSADKRDLFIYEAFFYFNPLLLAVSFLPTISVSMFAYGFKSIKFILLSFLYILYSIIVFHFHLIFMFQTFMVWLWGINLWFFAQGGVNYSKIFDLDQNHLTHTEIWKCAMWMTVIVPTSMTTYIYLYSRGEVAYAASQPVCSCMLLL